MIIRAYIEEDRDWVEEMHAKHFSAEFELPDFWNKFHTSFTIKNDDRILLVGGVRPIAELVCITDKDASIRERVIALKESVRAGMFVCHMNQYDQLHCFVQGKRWIQQVETVGFRETKGQALVLDV